MSKNSITKTARRLENEVARQIADFVRDRLTIEICSPHVHSAPENTRDYLVAAIIEGEWRK